MIAHCIRRYFTFFTMTALALVAGCSQESNEPQETATAPAFSATANVTDQALINAPNEAAEEWLSYGRDAGETRYSPLNQVNQFNVSELASPGLMTQAHLGDLKLHRWYTTASCAPRRHGQ